MTGDGRERRRFGRRSTFKMAVIVDGRDRQSPIRIQCIVVDISDGGARLQLDGFQAVPQYLELIIEADDFSVQCEIAWSLENQMGVKFIRSPRRLSWTSTSSHPSRLERVPKAEPI
jgi:hypothetical protein